MPVLNSALAQLAMARAESIAVALGTESHRAAASHTAPQDGAPGHGWALGTGDAGLAVAFDYLDRCRPGHHWDRVAHTLLARAAWSLAETGRRPELGLMQGITGVAFAAATMARGRSRYQKLLATLDERVAVDAMAMADAVERTLDVGLSTADFDLTAGLAGVAAYLTDRPGVPTLEPPFQRVTAVLQEVARVDGDVPGWTVPAARVVPDGEAGEPRSAFPHGYVNLGMAHGAAGLLAILAKAHRRSPVASRLGERVRALAAWLLAHRRDDRWGHGWPRAIPLVPSEAGGAVMPPRSAALGVRDARSAWCYGTPGVAAALWTAGEALGDSALRDEARRAVRATLSRPFEALGLESASICHGVAGLAHIAVTLAVALEDNGIRDGAAALIQRILDAYDPSYATGYANAEAGGRRVERHGLLYGSSGIMMVLASAASAEPACWGAALAVP